MKGLHSHHLDFEILPTSNTKLLVFLDASQYFEQPETPILQVTLPGFSKYFIVNIQHSQVNVLNSSTIGISNVLESECPIDLPDGVYTLTYKICPYKYLYITKYHLRTALLEKTLAKVYAGLDLHKCCVDVEDSKIKKSLTDIHILIESGKANADSGLIEKAQKDYQLASKLVNKLLDKITKNCE